MPPPKTECPMRSSCGPGPEAFPDISRRLSARLIKGGQNGGRAQQLRVDEVSHTDVI